LVILWLWNIFKTRMGGFLKIQITTQHLPLLWERAPTPKVILQWSLPNLHFGPALCCTQTLHSAQVFSSFSPFLGWVN
jgi:hypothetical protein